MVHGIRPDVPDSLICVKKSFLMNTDHLSSFFFLARAGCSERVSHRVTAAQVVSLLTLVLELAPMPKNGISTSDCQSHPSAYSH